MPVNTLRHTGNALLLRAFLFSGLFFSAMLQADSRTWNDMASNGIDMSRTRIDMNSAELQSLAKSTQMLVADNTGLHTDNVNVQVYHGYPDMAQVDAVNRHFQSGKALPDYAPDSFLGFVFSKPTITGDKVSIHVLYVLDAQGKPVNQIWLKLKSNPSLQKAFNKESKNTDSAAINVQQLQQAVFAQLKIPATDFEANAARIKQGPVWLDTPIERSNNNGKTVLTLPIVETPLNAPARFAGHFYIKLLTGFDASN